jgi:lipopolysaccharide transport system ATP-binding protein
LAVGDAEFQKKCLGKMKDVSENQGRTVLFVSHNLESIKKLCLSGLYLKSGTAESFDDIEKCFLEYLKSINKPLLSVRKIQNYFLNDFLEIQEFSISDASIRTFDDLDFLIKFRNHKKNLIDCVAILIYDEEENRIAIIDLRSSILIGSTRSEILITGTIKNIPLLRGEYRLGLAIGSTTCTGDFFNLLLLRVRENESNNLIQFPRNVMGEFAIKANFETSK